MNDVPDEFGLFVYPLEIEMAVLNVVLLVFFGIVAILLILIVLVQNEEGSSIGGIFAGGSGSAFGSRSGNILTRLTSVLGLLFFVISLGLALINRAPSDAGVEAAARQSASETNDDGWFLNEEEAEPSLETETPGIELPQPQAAE
jgi:preprotein translocase subunit SecG